MFSQPDLRASGPVPCATFRLEYVRVSAHEFRLLLRCELHHAKLQGMVQRREDPVADAEIGMTHVRAFDRACIPNAIRRK